MKSCAKCSLIKPEEDFVKDLRRKDKLYPNCKECSKEYYATNRERFLAQKREYGARPDVKLRDKETKRRFYLENREFYLEKRKNYYAIPENRVKLMYLKAKERAEEAGLEFSIDVSDIIIPEICPYLEIPLTHTLGQGQLETNSSLDRIDSSRGYVKGNVQVISRLANTMKNNATNEQLVCFARNILKIEGSNVTDYVNTILNYGA